MPEHSRFRFRPRVLAAVLGVGVAASVAVVTLADGGAGATTHGGTVHTTSGSSLTIRAKATTNSSALGHVPNGKHVTISCQTTGQSVKGRYGTSTVWDKTTYGGHTGFVSDAYVYTGSDGRVASACKSGTPPPPPPSSSVSKKIQAVVAAAKSQTGKGYSYSWGGGGKSGPSYGICCSPSGYDDRHRFGYDCSGLTQYAFWKGAHIDIGTVTSIQWNKGKKYPWSQRKVGDLLFWGTGAGTTHVAIYIGSGKMIEAAPPRGKYSVHVTNVYGSHSTVIRVIH